MNFQKYADGLIPAIIQDFESKQVLMLGFMNEEALQKTQESKKVTFFSRSRQRLWTKGEESGNFLEVVNIQTDCDDDTLLIKVKAPQATCHRGTFSCFGEKEEKDFLFTLFSLIQSRKMELPEESYTTSLFKKGIGKIAQKVGEEGVETVIAALHESDERLISESADLLFHLCVLLVEKNIDLKNVIAELQMRHEK